MKTLLEKLGYRVGVPALLWRVPDELVTAFCSVTVAHDQEPQFRIAFVRSHAEMIEAAEEVASPYREGGHLWLCYPKKTGKLRTDLTRDVGWDSIQALDLLGVTQVAINDTWSGLRFRYRSEIRSLTRKSPTGV